MPKKLLKKLFVPSALLMLLALIPIGCASTTRSSVASFCDVARPIPWAQYMHDEDIAAIKEHNARGVELCGWGR